MTDLSSRLYLNIFIIILFLFLSISGFAARCLGCPFDNNGGGGAGASYNCNTIGNTLYVDITYGSDSNDGKSWETAKKHLEKALYIASDCDIVTHILVAGGIYKPMVYANNKDYTYFIGNDITIQGGYPPGGPDSPNHVLYQTILEGQFSSNVNAHHIMVIHDVSGTVSISGFVFRNGFSDGTGSLEIASGIFMARDDGAAVYIKDSDDVRFTNCVFQNNVANDDGGAIFSTASTSKYTNVIFANNTAGVNGGGLYIQTNSMANLTNCAFVLNSYFTGGGGAIYNTVGSTINVYNTIIWGNANSWNGGGERNVFYSLIQDSNTQNGGSATNNVYVDPEFEDMYDIVGTDGDYFTEDDGLMVCRGSICVNRGLDTAFNISSQDIKKVTRIFNDQVDIGPYENENYPSVSGIPANGDSTLARVYEGKTSIPLSNCKILSILEPNTAINRQFKTVVRHNDSNFPEYNQYTKFVDRYYYLERVPIGNFNGKITLFFTNTDFVQFNNDLYSVNNLPNITNQNIANLRIVKFPGTSPSYFPDSYTSEPIIIDPEDAEISYGIFSGIWSVTFENSGSLGTFFVTTVYDYIFNGTGDFSNPSNWLNSIKPNGILPSLNRIIVNNGSNCHVNEAIQLKPFSQCIVEGNN